MRDTKDGSLPEIGMKLEPLDERFTIKDFKSPIEIDIDEQLAEL